MYGYKDREVIDISPVFNVEDILYYKRCGVIDMLSY